MSGFNHYPRYQVNVQGRGNSRKDLEIASCISLFRTCGDASVFLAELSGATVGVGVIKHHTEVSEIKRLWAEPQARGWGIGSALLDALLREAPNTASLTVWHWRTQARGLYLSRGFSVVPAWDRRRELICLRRSGTGGSRCS